MTKSKKAEVKKPATKKAEVKKPATKKAEVKKPATEEKKPEIITEVKKVIYREENISPIKGVEIIEEKKVIPKIVIGQYREC